MRHRGLVAGAALIVAALAIGLLLPLLAGFDRAVFGLLAMRRGVTPAVEIVAAQDVTVVGNLATRAVILAVGMAVFALRRRWRDVALLVAAALIAAVTTDAMKYAFERPRPNLYPYIGEFSNYSFPSGHASNTMALLLAIGLLARNRTLTVLGIGLALAVGVSRTMLDVHWPTDVLGGWLLGAGVVLVATGTTAALRPAP